MLLVVGLEELAAEHGLEGGVGVLEFGEGDLGGGAESLQYA